MRFYVIFTLIFMLMLFVVLLQVRRQAGLGRRAFGLTLLAGLGVSAFLASTRLMPESWSMVLARPAWWLGYGTFGLVAYLFLYQVITFCAEMAARLLLSRVCPNLAPRLRSPRALLAVSGLAFITVAWGIHAGGDVRELRHEIATPKVSAPVRVVVVSDLHLGALSLASRVEALAQQVRDQRPDILLLAGDIVNDHPEALEPYARLLAGIEPRLGSFGVFGNHERYEGDGRSARVFRWAGSRLLRGEVVTLPEAGVQILGIDDPGRAGDVTAAISQEVNELAPQLDPAMFRILMNHRPVAWREAVKPLGIELTVSGHTHRGQLFPFYLVVRLTTEFMGGFYEEDGLTLAVSGGAGFWGPPMRVLAPADILVLDIVPAR